MKVFLHFSFISFRYNFLQKVFLVSFILLINYSSSKAQCPAGYTSATVNWDNLDYLHRNGSIYGGTNPVTGLPFVTTAMAQTQYFAIGTNRLTISTVMPVGGSASLSGDVTTHTGDA